MHRRELATPTTARRSPHAARTAAGALLTRRLLCVSGKGGSGKTTVSAALGLAASSLGRRTIVCDLAGGDPLGRAFAVHRDRPGEVALTENL